MFTTSYPTYIGTSISPSSSAPRRGGAIKVLCSVSWRLPQPISLIDPETIIISPINIIIIIIIVAVRSSRGMAQLLHSNQADRQEEGINLEVICGITIRHYRYPVARWLWLLFYSCRHSLLARVGLYKYRYVSL